ncbi:MAG: hypothetical protein ABFC54_07720, partial [Thermoguttaceae bacterium]
DRAGHLRSAKPFRLRVYPRFGHRSLHPPTAPFPPTSTSVTGYKMWKARGVSEHLKRYGAVTHKSCGRKVYRTTLKSLQAIQANYGVDLGFGENLGEL